MQKREVEVYSDQTNAAVLRLVGRQFPGILMQGDSLSILCHGAESILDQAKGVLPEDALDELGELAGLLRGYLNHYKAVLAESGLSLPFED